MRRCIVAVLLLLGACGGDDDTPVSPEVEFLNQWPDLPAGPDFDGHPTKLDEAEKVLYMGDCAAVERATADGAEWDGYGTICPT